MTGVWKPRHAKKSKPTLTMRRCPNYSFSQDNESKVKQEKTERNQELCVQCVFGSQSFWYKRASVPERLVFDADWASLTVSGSDDVAALMSFSPDSAVM